MDPMDSSPRAVYARLLIALLALGAGVTAIVIAIVLVKNVLMT